MSIWSSSVISLIVGVPAVACGIWAMVVGDRDVNRPEGAPSALDCQGPAYVVGGMGVFFLGALAVVTGVGVLFM